MPDFTPLENKRERRNFNAIRAGHSGRIQWTARGVEDCVRHLQKEWLALAARGKAKDWEPYAEVLIYMRDRYGHLKATAHYFRMAAVIGFLERHMTGLKKAGIVKRDGEHYSLWDDALFEAFARLPFDALRGFRFSNVKNYVRRSQKPN